MTAVPVPMRLAIVLVVGLTVQLTVFVDVRVAGVAPELLALVAVSAGFVAGSQRGPVVGFLSGLLWDVYLPTPLGVAAVVFASVAYGVAMFSEGLFRDSRAQMAAILGLASTVCVIGYALLGSIVGGSGLLSFGLLGIAVVVGLVNALLSPIAALMVAWALDGEAQFR